MTNEKKYLWRRLVIGSTGLFIAAIAAWFWYYDVPSHFAPVPQGPFDVEYVVPGERHTLKQMGEDAQKKSGGPSQEEISEWITRLWSTTGWRLNLDTYEPEAMVRFPEGSINIGRKKITLNYWGSDPDSSVEVSRPLDLSDRAMYEKIQDKPLPDLPKEEDPDATD